jgi:hypothetical protein
MRQSAYVCGHSSPNGAIVGQELLHETLKSTQLLHLHAKISSLIDLVKYSVALVWLHVPDYPQNPHGFCTIHNIITERSL